MMGKIAVANECDVHECLTECLNRMTKKINHIFLQHEMHINGITINKPQLDLIDLQRFKAASVTWASCVSWCGIGYVTPDDARYFAHKLIQAADEADTLNSKTEEKLIQVPAKEV